MRILTASAAALLILVPAGIAQSICEDQPASPRAVEAACPAVDPPLNPMTLRLHKYALTAAKHRLCGLASYYSTSLDGSLTANGERFHQRDMTCAHLTLPIGTWVEVRSRATGRKVRLRVNDRGPYVKKFCLDLSQAAARALGVDVAEDRHVDIRILALPGEEPLTDGDIVAGEIAR